MGPYVQEPPFFMANAHGHVEKTMSFCIENSNSMSFLYRGQRKMSGMAIGVEYNRQGIPGLILDDQSESMEVYHAYNLGQ